MSITIHPAWINCVPFIMNQPATWLTPRTHSQLHRVLGAYSARSKGLISPHIRAGPSLHVRLQSTSSPAQNEVLARASSFSNPTAWPSSLSEPWLDDRESAVAPTAPAEPKFVSVTDLPCQLKPTTEPLSALDPETLSRCTSHLKAASSVELARLWFVFAASGTKWVVAAAPGAVKALEWARDEVNVMGLGRGVWSVFEFVSDSFRD